MPKVPPVKLCCAPFQGLIDSAGERGLSAIVVPGPKGPQVRIQSRACDHAQQADVRATRSTSGGLVNLLTQTGLKYCPHCGTRISKMVKRNREYFDRLVVEHRKFEFDHPQSDTTNSREDSDEE